MCIYMTCLILETIWTRHAHYNDLGEASLGDEEC